MNQTAVWRPPTEPVNPPAHNNPRVIQALEAYLKAVESGQAPDKAAFLAQHADIATALSECLEGLDFICQAASQVREADQPEPVLDAPELSPAQPLGDFQIIRELGRGGMGVVYEATQLSLGRRIALKVLPFASTLDSRQLLRFKNEAQAAACLHHTNIVPVFATGVARGVHYYAMQFIEGHTLAEVIACLSEPRTSVSGSAQPLHDGRGSDSTVAIAALSTLRSTKPADFFRTVAELGIQAAEALEYAHQMGIVHRDIKPANMMLESSPLAPLGRGAGGEGLRLWVMDFGLAQIQSDTRLTLTGDLLGTLRYMSPEQALGKGVILDQRTDIYSLCATLYELLTLEPAVDGRDRAEVLRKIADEEPRALRKIDRSIPAELETIVQKAMEKEAEGRYATAGELAGDLRRWLMHEPIRAKRPGLVLKTRKWGRRHKPLVGAAMAVLLVAVIGLAASAVLVWQHNRELEEKNKDLVAANESAQKRLGQLEKSNQIMTSIFDDLNIVEVRNGTEPLEAVLAQRMVKAAKQLEAEEIGEPLVMMKMQDRLGRSLMNLGYPQDAIPLLIRSRETSSALLGADHPSTLRSMNNLASGYRGAGKLDLALSLNEETLKRRKATLGNDHPDTLESMNNLAGTYADAGKLDLALRLHEETLKRRKATLGDDHNDTLLSMNNLANAYRMAGKQDLALPLFKEVLPLVKAKRGADHIDTLLCMNNLAGGYWAAGKMDLALSLFEENLPLTKTRLGPNHPQTLMAMNNLATCYAELGKVDQAIPLSEESLKLTKKKWGDDHPDTLICMGSLAFGYRAAGKLDLALPLLEETLKLMKLKHGADHPDTLVSMNNLASTYLASGKPTQAFPVWEEAASGMERLGFQHQFAERIIRNLIDGYEKHQKLDQAEAWRRKWLAVAQQRSGADSPTYARELAALGLNLLHQKKWADAEAVFRECLAIQEKKVPNDPVFFNTRSQLGGALLGQGKYAEAEPLLLEGYQGLKQREAKIPVASKVRLTEAAERLAQFYEATGKTDEAAKWRKELEATKSEKKPVP